MMERYHTDPLEDQKIRNAVAKFMDISLFWTSDKDQFPDPFNNIMDLDYW